MAKGDIKFTWMDGGLLPERPEELRSDEMLGDAMVVICS